MTASPLASNGRRTIRLLILLVFAAAGFAGLRALAQAPTAGIPAAPPGGINASKLPDINGVHLGMTQDEALAVMKRLYPGDLLLIKRARFDNGQVWIAQLEAKAAETCNGQCSDLMVVGFTTPPNPVQVVGIQRSMRMAPDKRPTVETTLASLRQKYGKELVFVSNGGVMAWAYDEQGQPINPQGPSNWSPADCASVGLGAVAGQTGNPPLLIDAPPMGPTPLAQLLPNLTKNLCNRDVYLNVQLGQLSIQGTPVVQGIEMTLGEKSLMLRDAVASQQYFEAKQQQQQQQEMKRAQQQKAPSL